ncbi:GIY-YIG nuclease family protein [Methanobrevibacter sp.]|uniref:GIY-YIG nuclease family protein n=1 Tax=Methanobrevibacter sp. TaxID=66852 RepID=UPI003867B8E6
MAKLLLRDIMSRSEIDPNKVKLIRHALSNDKCRDYHEKGWVKEYTAIQNREISKGYDYWMVFYSGNGTTAIFDSFYKVKGLYPNTIDNMPEDFRAPEDFNGEELYYDLERLDTLKDYEGRLIIEWGKSARNWHQKGTTDKEVLAIQAVQKYPFSGYEKIILRFNELKEIIEEPALYSDWHAALKAVKGIYLITDTKNKKLYVGSAYGENGILGRWTEYIETKDGGNKKLRELLKEDPNAYKSFQFSILHILPKAISEDEVIDIENRYKDKLLTRSEEFGLNGN